MENQRLTILEKSFKKDFDSVDNFLRITGSRNIYWLASMLILSVPFIITSGNAFSVAALLIIVAGNVYGLYTDRRFVKSITRHSAALDTCVASHLLTCIAKGKKSSEAVADIVELEKLEKDLISKLDRCRSELSEKRSIVINETNRILGL